MDQAPVPIPRFGMWELDGKAAMPMALAPCSVLPSMSEAHSCSECLCHSPVVTTSLLLRNRKGCQAPASTDDR